MRTRPRRNVSAMAAASVPSVSSAAKVVTTAKPDIQSRIRPTGYHSISGAAGVASSSPGRLTGAERPSSARCPSHQAGRATETVKAMQ